MADQALNIQPVVDWLIEGARPLHLPRDVLLDTCRRTVAAGVAIHRVGVFVRTLHPNLLGRAFIWQADKGAIEMTEAGHDLLESEAFLKSPIRVVMTDDVEIRRRLADPACPIDFPILQDLRDDGATDFLAEPLRFVNGEVHAASFATRRPGGFRDDELAALRRLLPPFTRMVEIYGNMQKARNILDAYLGTNAGAKVLAGHIRRGDGQDINAVIWFCDLRDSTPLADSMSRRDFLQLLNEYFECVLGSVLEQGGEVLRFIGDAALAIFPVGEQPAEACAKALAAAQEAHQRMDKLNQGRARPLRFGIGLHLGELTFGNIGTPTRIEFTVIGAAANEAARIESMCKVLDVNLLVSERFAQALPRPWRSLGSHTLRGVGDKMPLFTLP